MRTGAVAAVIAGGLVGTGSAAQAVPTLCDEHVVGNGYYVYCGRGDGQYRAHVQCWYNHGTQSRHRYGPWRVPNGTHSEVSCLNSEELGGYWTDKKN
jgi:hypothetical protein